MCRNTLSPIVQQLQWVQSNSGPSREEIAQTASRVRNAMRYIINCELLIDNVLKFLCILPVPVHRIGIARRLANAAV